MKKRTTFLLGLMFLISGLVAAQTSIDVAPTNGSGDPVFLNEFIEGNPGFDEYRLISTDITYYLNASLNVNASMKIVGVTEEGTGRKPTIQPLQAADQSDLQILIVIVADDITLELEDLYIFGKSNANTRNSQVQAISVTTNNVHVISNRCVYDEVTQFIISYQGAWDKFTITNNHIRNGSLEGNNPWVSELLRNLAPANPTGDVLIQNNTFLGLNAYVACPNVGSVNSKLIVDHNTIVYGTKNPLFIFAATDAEITNNIFYSTFCASGNSTSISGGWDDVWDGGNPTAVISLDTLKSPNFDFTDFAPELIGDPDSVAKGEALRNVVVKNNAYFWPSEVTNFITGFNDTASAATKVQMPQWINERTSGMFANDAFWPGFEMSGNIEADPDFDQAIKDIAVAGNFTAYLHNAYVGGADQISYHFAPNIPDGTLEWQPTWPLVENLKYNNTALQTAGTDGKPLGDLNWFGGVVGIEDGDGIAALPTDFNLEQNYPNPFNPSTKISFAIPQSSNVTLKVFDLLGSEVKTLVSEVKAAGTYTISWNGDNKFNQKVSSGIYFYTLSAGDVLISKKMVLMK